MDKLDFYDYFDAERFTIKGMPGDYLGFHAKRDAAGRSLIENELKERLSRIKRNVVKSGSLKKLLDAGGKAAEAYIVKARNLVIFMILGDMVSNIALIDEDLAQAVKMVKELKTGLVDRLVISSSFEEIEEKAQSLREEFVSYYFDRINSGTASERRSCAA